MIKICPNCGCDDITNATSMQDTCTKLACRRCWHTWYDQYIIYCGEKAFVEMAKKADQLHQYKIVKNNNLQPWDVIILGDKGKEIYDDLHAIYRDRKHD